MKDIIIKFPVEDLTAIVQKTLSRGAGTPLRFSDGNPVAEAICESLKELAPEIKAIVKDLSVQFLNSDNFADKIREVYKDAILGEAVRMGKNAARAIVNAKE